MSVSTFLVTVSVNGKWRKIGFVDNGKRLQCDAATGQFFPANTRMRKDLLKACRWCLDGSAVIPQFVEFQTHHSLVRVAPIKN